MLKILFILLILPNIAIAKIYNVISDYSIVENQISVSDDETYSSIKKYISDKYNRLGLNNVKITILNDEIHIDEENGTITNIEAFEDGVEIKDIKELLRFSENYITDGWSIDGTDLLSGLERIKILYQNDGYPSVDIKYFIDDKKLLLKVTKNNRMHIIDTKIQSDIVNVELFDSINNQFKENDIYSRAKIETIAGNIKSYLDNNGYYDGKIIINKTNISDKNAILYITINGYKKKKIGDIIITGWRIDSEYTPAYLKIGDDFNLLKVKKEISNIYDTGLFADVTPGITQNGDLVVINIKLTDKKTGLISSGISNTNGINSVFLNVEEKNFLNKGILLSASIQQSTNNLNFDTHVSFKDRSSYGVGFDNTKIGEDEIKKNFIYNILKFGGRDTTTISSFVYNKSCDLCVSTGTGAEIKFSHEFFRANNRKDPTEGMITSIGINADYLDKTDYFIDFKNRYFLSFENNFFLKNSLLIGLGFGESYYYKNINDFSIKGISYDLGYIINDDKVIRDDLSVYRKNKLFGLDFNYGAYVNVINGINRIDDTKYTIGANLTVPTAMGDFEIYKVLGSNIDNWDGKIGIAIEKKF